MPKIANLIVEMHLALFAFCCLIAVVIGYLMGKRKEAVLTKRALDAENEMIQSNNEVLRYAEINKQLTETLEKAKIPLPSITRHKEEEKLRSIPLEKIG
ncbi:MAG: hypothetical protein K2X48_08110 [Chitinophagaceae bacterium]|nr:hypothetical protein [Chitinophagaceae bacterium]